MDFKLAHDEALLLFDWLADIDEDAPYWVENDTVLLVLWMIQGQLESELVEPFMPDYCERVADAKKSIRRRWDKLDEKPGA